MSLPADLMHQVDMPVLIGFLFALLFLDAYDVFLPRGQGISISGPLIGAMVVLLDSPAAIVAAVLASLIVHVVRGLAKGEWTGSFEMLLRLLSSAGAYLVSLALLESRLSSAELVIVPATYLIIEFVLRQAYISYRQQRPLRSLIRSNGMQQSLLLAAQMSTAALTVVTQESMGLWSLIPVVALLLLMRQAYAMLVELHETYRSTVSILIEAAEAQLPALSGHSDRTSRIARDIATRCALTSSEIEMVEYAALLHDVDRISAADDVVTDMQFSADVIRDVEFLQNVVPVLDLMAGRPVEPITDRGMMSAFIVALASAIDAGNEGVHGKGEVLNRLSTSVPGRIKASVVSAALELGYPVPAID